MTIRMTPATQKSGIVVLLYDKVPKPPTQIEITPHQAKIHKVVSGTGKN